MLKPLRDEVLVEVMPPETFIYLAGEPGSPKARVLAVSERVRGMEDSVRPGDVVLIPETRPELNAGALLKLREREILGVVEEAA